MDYFGDEEPILREQEIQKIEKEMKEFDPERRKLVYGEIMEIIHKVTPQQTHTNKQTNKPKGNLNTFTQHPASRKGKNSKEIENK